MFGQGLSAAEADGEPDVLQAIEHREGLCLAAVDVERERGTGTEALPLVEVVLGLP